jgi:2',3'-cyclic-nucleotide 2'-phosphodiesterase (5'-nucleotidase family)
LGVLEGGLQVLAPHAWSGRTSTWTAILLLSAAFCGCAIHAKRRESNAEAILVSFGSTQGQAARSDDHTNGGGLALRRSWVDSLRAHGKDFALLDLGDFMSVTWAGEMETRFIWKQMEDMGYAATTPGVREVGNWRLFQDLLRGSTIQCVSSNLTVVEGGKRRPAGLRTLVAETGGVRFGFFGLLGDPEMTPGEQPPAGIEFEHADPVETARQIVPELRARAEIVVLLSQLTSEDTESLIEQVPGIDVALFGRQPHWDEWPGRIGQTITQSTGARGRFAGELVLVVDPSGRILQWGSHNARLDRVVPEDPEVLAAVKQLELDVRAKMEEERRRQGAPPRPGN